MLGKTRRPEIHALLDNYIGRISHYMETEVIELRDAGPSSLRKLKLDPAATVVLLDAVGKQYTSQQFARSRHARADFSLWRCGRLPRRNPRQGETKNLALDSHDAS